MKSKLINRIKDILLINHQIIHIKPRGVVTIDLIPLIKLLLHHLLAPILLPIHPTITLVSSLRLQKMTPFDSAQDIFLDLERISFWPWNIFRDEMSRSLQLGLRTGDLFQTPSVPRSCSGIISNIITAILRIFPNSSLKLIYRYKGRISSSDGKYFNVK